MVSAKPKGKFTYDDFAAHAGWGDFTVRALT